MPKKTRPSKGRGAASREGDPAGRANNSHHPASTEVIASEEVVVTISYKLLCERLLTCSICLENYNREDQRPKLLPCSHTACLPCMQQIVAQAQVQNQSPPRCPLCRRPVPLPYQGAQALPANFVLNELMHGSVREPTDESGAALRSSREWGRTFSCASSAWKCSVRAASQGSPRHMLVLDTRSSPSRRPSRG